MKNKMLKTLFSIVVGIAVIVLVFVGMYFSSPKPKFVAHQGYRVGHLGNTEGAFLAAAEMNFYGIETDIRKTADGVYVCSHDKTVKFANGEEKEVAKSNYAELASPLENKEGGEVFLCSFERYLDICKSNEKVALIELKEEFDAEAVTEILAIVDERYERASVSIISFYFDVLLRVREQDPSISLQYLSETKNDPIFDRCLEEKVSISIRQSILTKKIVRAFHSAGLTVNTWTVNKWYDRIIVRFKGADYVTTDVYDK